MEEKELKKVGKLNKNRFAMFETKKKKPAKVLKKRYKKKTKGVKTEPKKKEPVH